MGTLKAGAIARLRAETLGLRSTPVQTHKPPVSSPAPQRTIEASCQQGKPCGNPDNCPDPAGCGFVVGPSELSGIAYCGPSEDLLEAARLSRLAKEHCALIEAEDAEAQLRAVGVDDSDARKLVAWHRDVEEKRRRGDLWAMVREIFPTAFGDPADPIPLKIGIHRDLATEIGIADARRLLKYWCSRPQYRAAATTGVTRYALDGTPAGTVTEAEAAAACRSSGNNDGLKR